MHFQQKNLEFIFLKKGNLTVLLKNALIQN